MPKICHWANSHDKHWRCTRPANSQTDLHARLAVLKKGAKWLPAKPQTKATQVRPRMSRPSIRITQESWPILDTSCYQQASRAERLQQMCMRCLQQMWFTRTVHGLRGGWRLVVSRHAITMFKYRFYLGVGYLLSVRMVFCHIRHIAGQLPHITKERNSSGPDS